MLACSGLERQAFTMNIPVIRRAICLVNAACGCLLFWASETTSNAAKLDPTAWTIYNFSGSLISSMNAPLPPTNLHIVTNNQPAGGPAGATNAGNVLTGLTDGNLSTYTTLAYPASMVIDLGQTCAIDRVYLIGSIMPSNFWPNYGGNGATPPLGLIVAYVGNSMSTSNQVGAWTVPYDAGNPVETEADIRFSPATGRYVRLELHTQVAWGTSYWPGYLISQPASTNVSINVGEIEVYGFTGTNALATNVNAVVVPPSVLASINSSVYAQSTYSPLAIAAGDLSYYLGELTGLPHPIILPSQSNQFSGTIYRIEDLASLAPNYGTMMANIASGSLQTNVTVGKAGNQIIFSTWPYRAVLWSVWSFLEANGVRWVYPNAHGDYVPVNGGVNLSIAPYTSNPPTESVLANFDLCQSEPWSPWINQSVRPEMLYWYRNHWTWPPGLLGGGEIPRPAQTGTIGSLFTEGFGGYPENFRSVMPDRILEMPAYTNWWGWNTTNSSSATESSAGTPTFAMDTPSAITWVAQKVTNWNAVQPTARNYPLNYCYVNRPWQLLPNDACSYSEDPYSMASNGPVIPDPVPWVKIYNYSWSGAYFSFVNSVAKQVQQMGSGAMVGALAYADVFLPPTNIPALAVFPTNVQVEVCYYGAPNLPMTASANAGMAAAFNGWRAACSHLATYDYALLHTDMQQPNPQMPVPLVAGTLARSQFIAALGALDGGTQANLSSLPYNPWNFYAYPRTRWNPNQTAAQLESEFFTGYFSEAAAPMLAYYQAMENWQVTNGINLRMAGYCYSITPNSYPPSVLSQMQIDLAQASALATNWWVVQRIANMQAGLGWLITNSPDNLVGVNLANSAQWPTISTSTTTTNVINLQSLYKPTKGLVCADGAFSSGSGASSGWVLPTAGQVQQTYNFSGGTYNFTLMAHAYQGPPWPILDIYFGPSFVTGITLTNTTSQAFNFSATVPTGAFDISICAENWTGASFLYVDQLTSIRE
jgi:hypothetical protein